MRPNPGRLPDECIVLHHEYGTIGSYRRVHVILVNGWDSRKHGAPWPAGGGKPPTVWKRHHPPHPFDVAFYELAD